MQQDTKMICVTPVGTSQRQSASRQRKQKTSKIVILILKNLVKIGFEKR